MIKDSINKSNVSLEGKDTNEDIPESSPAYQFCHKKFEINIANENGWTPIYRSIISNDLEALKELLKLGANPNICNNLGESPIYLCVDMNNMEALIIILNNSNEIKVNCNIQKKNGDTALHLSIKKKKLNFANILLENNADPNISNKLYSQTPTHLAIINKVNEFILQKLKMNDADIYTIKDKYDKTSYDYALEHNDKEYIKLIHKIFGEKKQKKSLCDTINDDLKKSTKSNKSNKSNKSGNKKDCSDKKKIKDEILKKFENENHIQNAIYNTNIKNKNENSNESNNVTNDKKIIKEIIFSEVNKVNISEFSQNNNNYSYQKDNNIINFDENNKISSFLNDNIKNDINNINVNETNPLEMMNKIIISNSLEKEKEKNNSIDNIRKSLYDENEINDSLEPSKGKNENKFFDQKEKNENENENKRTISYLGSRNKKEKIIPKLNLVNESNNINNNNTIQNNNRNKKRKSYISNYSYSNNNHYESSTNPNTSRGSYMANCQNNNNIITSPKNYEKSNYVYLTQGNEPEYNGERAYTISIPNKKTRIQIIKIIKKYLCIQQKTKTIIIIILI